MREGGFGGRRGLSARRRETTRRKEGRRTRHLELAIRKFVAILTVLDSPNHTSSQAEGVIRFWGGEKR